MNTSNELIVEYFNSLIRDIEEADRHMYSNDMNIIETCHRKIENQCQSIINIITSVEQNDLKNLLESLYTLVYNKYICLETLINSLSEIPRIGNNICIFNQIGAVGRPTLKINTDQILYLRRTGLSWTKVAKVLNISRSSLYRHKHILNLPDPVSDNELQDILIELLKEMPNTGETYIIGALKAKNIHVARWRIREQLRFLDPVGRALRKRNVVRRRVYRVHGPNYLWYFLFIFL